jgi:hypothetical protein
MIITVSREKIAREILRLRAENQRYREEKVKKATPQGYQTERGGITPQDTGEGIKRVVVIKGSQTPMR